MKPISPFKNTTVLVTGGSGFIGTNLVAELLRLQAKVTILDLKPPHPSNKQAHFIQKDIRHPHLFLKSDVFDYVFHLAARTDLDGKTLQAYACNDRGTQNLLHQLHQKNLKRFIYYSTQLATGLTGTTRFLDDSAPYFANTLYGQSKINAEKIVMNWAKKTGQSFAIIRPTSVFGPHGGIPFRQMFLLIKKRYYFHIGKADNLFSYCYVKNLIDLTLLVATHPKAHRLITYGNDLYPYPMRQFVGEVEKYFGVSCPTLPQPLVWLGTYLLYPLKLLGLPVPLYPSRIKNLTINCNYDLSKVIALGYTQAYSLQTAVKETLDWYARFNKGLKK